MTRRDFPADFVWGAATASYQVEGAIRQDGRTPSIWDVFCDRPGAIADGSSGQVACDQYHRYRDDIALMAELGVESYRFSIAWPRIQPSPDGKVNRAGLDHYARLCDALLEAGIAPVATLYHWDLPQYLEQAGGWPNRATAERFADYAGVVAQSLGDRIDTWTTLNEPWCVAYLGYAAGEHAPGRRDHPAALAAAHHLNLAHGLAVQAIRGQLGPAARTSITLNLQVLRPATDSPEDLAAVAQLDRIGNQIWLGPLLDGRYDERLFQDTAHVSDWSFVRAGDLAQIHQPLSVLGLNYYSSSTVRHRPGAVPPTWSQARQQPWCGPWPGAETVEFLPPVGPLTAMGWNQDPAGLTELLLATHRRWPQLELMVTENGSAFEDQVAVDGTIHDPERVAYLAAHIEALGQALDAGAPVRGYFAWSLIDNFEWAHGYTKRFGLFGVDYATQARLWKDSARWYQSLIAAGATPD
ncbi:MAG: beta-glucosidase [Propionibacteriaceae bacterium]|jgi:beta-glucosidase|nr:beta-glucosidase [Propionibacteriaceae bacterium]